MYRKNRSNTWAALPLLGAVALLAANGAAAQQAPADNGPATLKQAFAAAWARQPEARSLELRRAAAEAGRQAAESWLSEPPALELSGKSDRATGNEGNREYVAGLALPLWLPGERAATGALAEAEANAAHSRATSAQLRTAAAVREAWWNWQRAQAERSLVEDRLASARRLAGDVARRVKAGDLARADQHQADGALAAAEAEAAQAAAALAVARQQLRAVAGRPPVAGGEAAAEAMPGNALAADDRHPLLAELSDRATVARRQAELSGVQTRANPELTLQTTRERDAFGEDWGQSLTVGVRIPFGSASRNKAKASLARAEAVEAEEQARLESERLASDVETARLRVEAARQQSAAADKRARLAADARTFFEKSFCLGESDLPTRLRIEFEAVEAGRQAGRARIEHAAAVSALRQALGLLPE